MRPSPTAPPARRRILSVLALAAASAAAVLLPASAASADVNDFSYSSWDSQYEVSLDADGHAQAHVTETLVAEFPESDQNKGIIRGYPERYEGAGLNLEILSVKDAEGRDVPYETEHEDGMLLVLTGDDDYVHGPTTYVIESAMRDFMIHGSQTKNDEFYWNLLPLNSTQPIDRFHASIEFSPELSDALTGDAACYRGQAGERLACTIDGPQTDADGATFTVESGTRLAGDGVTLAIGFSARTVTQPPARAADPVADFGPAVTGLGAIGLAAGAWVSVAVLKRRRRGATGVIVAQFDVPADLPPLLAAPLVPGAPNPVPAQMVHLAVQGAVRLEEESLGQGGKKRPALRLIDRSAARDPLDGALIDAVFPGDLTVRRIPRSSTKFAKRMDKLVRKGRSEAKQRGWLTEERSRGAMAFGWAAVALVALTVAFVVWSATKDRDLLPLSIVAVIFAITAVAITAFVAFSKHTVLTPAGAERYEYLLGVKEFIRVAEADRLKMLQSYQGAERRSDGTVDIVHLYEKLLPYAMLLGQEKSWTAALETAYSSTNRRPGWIDTASGISIGASLSQYSTSMRTAATYSPTSSSSGGSAGGGFSGGGGGGGFSGGR